MKQISKRILPSFIAILLISPALKAQDDDAMALLAAQASLIKAQKWIDFLKQNEIPVDHYVLSEFEMVKERRFITIMGGLDEAPIQAIITELVGADEASSLAKKGAKKMLLKEDVWKPGQKILIFVGSDAEAAAAIRTESRDEWMEYLDEWFDLGEGPGGLRAY
jgi:hypothetical protein